MQTTLLGLAFALILALLAALVGPFLVDWNQFRPVFEAEASRMIGLPVRVKGSIDARLLPSPSLTLHGLEIGEHTCSQTAAGSQFQCDVQAVHNGTFTPVLNTLGDILGRDWSKR